MCTASIARVCTSRSSYMTHKSTRVTRGPCDRNDEQAGTTRDHTRPKAVVLDVLRIHDRRPH